MQETKTQFDYTELHEWLRAHKLTWADLASEVGVTPGAVSQHKVAGKLFPTSWILKWRRVYSWTWDEMIFLCLDSKGGIR